MTISETDSKNKRGRPGLIPPELESTVSWLAGPGASERTKQNAWYKVRAIHVIGKDEDPALKWLFDADKCAAGYDTWKPGILTELGRIEDEADLLAMAKHIAREKPKTKEAVSKIREYRLGGKPQATDEGLANAIIAAIQNYDDRHSGLTGEMITEALTIMQMAINDKENSG